MKIAPGSVVVFEGLDKTGKSEQIKLLQEAVTNLRSYHMPSVQGEGWTEQVYQIMEDRENKMSNLSRQLLHMACHEHAILEVIIPLAKRDAELGEPTGVLLDRWWWSTMAYGWYSGVHTRYSRLFFMKMLETIWKPVEADAIFVFTEVYVDDDKNRESVRDAYHTLAEGEEDSLIFMVPRGTPAEVHEFIISSLKEEGVIE